MLSKRIYCYDGNVHFCTSSQLTWLKPFALPGWIPETLPPPPTPNSHAGPEPLPVAPPHKWPARAHTVVFPKCSQRSANPKQAAVGLSLPCIPLDKWPQAQHKRWPGSTCIVTPIRWPEIWHMWWPVLAWNIVSTKWPQTQYNWELVSSHMVVPTKVF